MDHNDVDDKKPWCSILVDENGKHIGNQNKWGYCASECPTHLVESKSVCPDICPAVYSPVCGSDGRTYNNKCEFNIEICETGQIDLEIINDGDCQSKSPECPEICPEIYSPVCGSDGNTYNNKCEFNIEICETGQIDLEIINDGECKSKSPHCPEICPANYDPVYGSDGKIYPNRCQFEAVKCKSGQKDLEIVKIETYKQALDKCSENNSEALPYYNQTKKSFDCLTILKKGPCQQNQWFTLSKELFRDMPMGKCQLNQCSDKEPSLYVLYNNTCEIEFSGEKCGPNMQLRVNFYGEGNNLNHPFNLINTFCPRFVQKREASITFF